MKKQDLLQELRNIRSVAMASVDAQGNPKNRIIDVMLADENAIYFCTARGKAFYQELMMKPVIAITGMNASWQINSTFIFSILSPHILSKPYKYWLFSLCAFFT